MFDREILCQFRQELLINLANLNGADMEERILSFFAYLPELWSEFFHIKISNFIQCKNGHHIETSPEEYSCLQLHISKVRTDIVLPLSSLLDDYFQIDLLLTEQDKWFHVCQMFEQS